MKGQLADRPFSDLLGELYRTRSNGILKVNRENQTKAIFIEDGNPVFALSNAAEDQLSDMLVREGLVDELQLSQLGTGSNVQQMAQKLAESGLVSVADLDSALQRLTSNAILSIFEWPDGVFEFERKDRARLAMSGKLQKNVTQLILMGARKTQSEAKIRALLGDKSRVVKPTSNASELLTSAQLEGQEGFLMSRITEPIPIGDVINLLGLPDSQALQNLFVLVSAGFLQVEGGKAKSSTVGSTSTSTRPTPPPAKPPEPVKIEPKTEAKAEEFDEAKFQQEVMRMMAFFASADLYEVLGVLRRANEADIKKAYYQLAKKYHPDRVHKSSSPELKTALEKVFTKITEAYEKLKDPETRKRYDEQIRGKPEPTRNNPSMPKPTPQPPKPAAPAPAPTPPPQPAASAPTPPRTSQPPAQSSRPAATTPTPPAPTPPPPQPAATRPAAPAPAAAAAPAQGSPQPAAAAAPVAGQKVETVAGKTTVAAVNKVAKTPEMAEANFNQGKVAYSQQDFARAAYLFREAVTIAPDNRDYRLQLVQTLMRNQKWHKEAEEHLNKLLEGASFDASSANLHAMLGLIYKAGGLQSRAEAKFNEAVTMDPTNKIAKRELRELKGGGGGSAKDSKDIKAIWAGLPTFLKAALGIGLLMLLYYGYSFLFAAAPPPPAPNKTATPAPAASPAKKP